MLEISTQFLQAVCWAADGRLLYGYRNDPASEREDSGIWSVRVSQKSGEPEGKAVQLSKGAGIVGGLSDLHPILRDEVYKIAAEALRNAFRHAQARHIEVEIRYDKEQFRLRVRDDGKGIDAEVLSQHGVPGHYGLPGMRERAKVMRAKLTVWSEADAGTEVELRVGGSTAYEKARRGSWLTRAFAGSSDS